MELTSFYQAMIRPPLPWTVGKVEVHAAARRVDIWLVHADGLQFACPECGRPSPVNDHTAERNWRHLDTCEYETWLHARLPRISCKEHGVLQVRAPLSSGSSRFTVAMESRCIDVLAECSCSGASELMRLSWDEMKGVMERAVARGMERRAEQLPEALGIDEKSVFARHQYFTIINDLKRGVVWDVVDNRDTASVMPWFEERLPLLSRVKTVAIDMSAGYSKVVEELMPSAKICYDHFHVTRLVNQGVDEVRKQEQQQYAEDDRFRREFFRSRFLFLYNQENVPGHRAEQFQRLRKIAVKTGRAWAIKENFRELWQFSNPDEASAFFRKWHAWAIRSCLAPMAKAAQAVKRHWTGVLNAIVRGVSNACSEGLNGKIERVKRMAFGFRSKKNFRTAILFHCGGLDLYPALH